jgi:LPXTG-motif cell wall-anchored protein
VADRYFDVDASTDGLIAYTVSLPGSFIAKVKKSVDGGLSWTELSSSPSGKWEAVSTSGDGDVVAVAGWIDGTGTGYALYISTDAGTTWTRRGTNSEAYDDVAVSADGDTIVVARPSGVATSTDDGVTWTTRGQAADDVAVSADGTVIVASEFSNKVARSVDSGVTWTELVAATPTALWQDIAISDDGETVFGVVFEDQGYIWKGRSGTPTRYATGSLGFGSNQAVRGAVSPDGNTFIAGRYGALPRVLRSWDRVTDPATLTWESQATPNAVLGLSITDRGERFIVVTEGGGGIWAFVPAVPGPSITGARRTDCGSTLFGPAAGGTEIMITGRYLFDATVTVGGVAATIVRTYSGDQLDVAVPNGVVGAAPVVLTTPSGSATVSGGFTYRAPPVGWSRVGADIVGESGSYSGTKVASSADGSIIAVSTESGDVGGMILGFVRVYARSGNTWVQRGGDIIGAEDGGGFGYSLAMSADGNTLVVGAPYFDGAGFNVGQVRIFRWSGSGWSQLGASIEGTQDLEYYGTSVATSADGETVIVGVPEVDQVRVYRWSGTSWAQLGGDIPGTSAYRWDYFGSVLASSADGNTFAATAINVDVVRVFRRTGSSWVQVGADIDGGVTADEFGSSLAMSADGETVVVGDPYADVSGTNTGTVRVFDFDGSDWTERAGPFVGDAGVNLGVAVDISDDGAVVAYSAPRACRYEFIGEIVVQQWNGTGWSPLGDFVPAPVVSTSIGFPEFGRAIALSGSGDTIVASDVNADSYSGAAFVWRYGAATAAASASGPSVFDESAPAVTVPIVAPVTELPNTGANHPWWVGLVLLMSGGVLLVSARRQRTLH